MNVGANRAVAVPPTSSPRAMPTAGSTFAPVRAQEEIGNASISISSPRSRQGDASSHLGNQYAGLRHDRVPPDCAVELWLGRTAVGENPAGSSDVPARLATSDACSH